MIKTQKKKVPGLSTESDPMGGGGDRPSSLDIGQLNVSFGKNYILGKSLGPSVNEDALKVG